MAIEKKNMGYWFQTGRGNVSANVAKSNAEVMHEESEIIQDGMEPTGMGGEAQDHGNKPIYATGEMPFHHGRGAGRGHGPETAKNA